MNKKNKTKFFSKEKNLSSFFLSILFILTFLLIFFNKTEYFIIYHIKSASIDFINPISKVISFPIRTTIKKINSINDLRFVQQQNIKLKEEIIRLKKWQTLSIQSVRENLVMKQQLISENSDIVMVGRDIGTVVLPKAKFKFFLDCSLNERAIRRMHQSKKKKFINEKDKINYRDLLDTNRKISPLIPSDDAVIVFNDHINLEETVKLIKDIVLN